MTILDLPSADPEPTVTEPTVTEPTVTEPTVTLTTVFDVTTLSKHLIIEAASNGCLTLMIQDRRDHQCQFVVLDPASTTDLLTAVAEHIGAVDVDR